MKILLTFGVAMAALLVFFTTVHADSPVPQNVGVFGDSLADGAWSGMYNFNKKHPEDKLFRHAKVGSGITRGDFAAWMTELGSELDADHTTTAVIIVGVNDQQSIRDDNHKGYLFKSDGWRRVYLSRVDAIMAEFEKRKIPIVWFGLPILRDADLNAGGIYLSDLIANEVKGHQVSFIPLIDAFKDDKGAFASHLPDAAGKVHPVRADDGVHFTPYGYELIGEKAYAAIASLPMPVSPMPDTTSPSGAVPPNTLAPSTSGPVAPVPSPGAGPTPTEGSTPAATPATSSTPN